MIAAVKGCHAVLSALLFLLPLDAQAADDLGGAARELARKAAAFAGRGETVSVSWRNLSGLPSGDLAQARSIFEPALRDSGARLLDSGAAVDLRVTLSENQSQYLLVAEARKGDDRQVLIATWKRAAAATAAGGATLERKLLWEQSEVILDAALTPAGILVLSPAKLTLYARRETALEERGSVPVAPAKPWPRDPRARLSINGAAIRAFLPGTLCTGAIEPALTLECHASEEMWTLEAGGRSVLLAAFSPGRNHFDGRIVTQSGVRKTVAPFYTAAAVDSYWLLSLLDGRTQILDNNFEVAGAISGWGSDLASASARCGTGFQIFATKPGEAREPDSLRAYALVNRTPVPLTPAIDFTGPVTALWSAGGPSVIAVSYDLETARYAVYLITVVCNG